MGMDWSLRYDLNTFNLVFQTFSTVFLKEKDILGLKTKNIVKNMVECYKLIQVK